MHTTSVLTQPLTQLRVVKNDLIPIFENEGQLEVSGEDLYKELQIRKDKTNWMKAQIDFLELTENIDFRVFALKGEKPKRGRPVKTHYFPIDIAKEIAMISRTKIGKVIRKYFIEVEKEYRQAQNHNPYIGKSPMELLEISVAMVKEKDLIIQQQNNKIIKLKPQAQLAKDFLGVLDKDINFNTMAKLSKFITVKKGKSVGGKLLKDACIEDGIISSRDRLPKQFYINQGYFKVFYVHKYFGLAGEHYVPTTLITPKGQKWLYNRLFKTLTQKP